MHPVKLFPHEIINASLAFHSLQTPWVSWQNKTLLVNGCPGRGQQREVDDQVPPFRLRKPFLKTTSLRSWSSSLSLPAGITGACHHAWLFFRQDLTMLHRLSLNLQFSNLNLPKLYHAQSPKTIFKGESYHSYCNDLRYHQYCSFYE